MNSAFHPVFKRLRAILEQHAASFAVGHDTPEHYGLEAPVGPATIRAWRGKLRSPTIPVAWVQIGKAYVSYHLMGVYGQPKLLEGYSDQLQARMQGKSCFNFKESNETLFQELERLTAQSLMAMRNAGFVSTD
jgi:hypothetical protein